MNLLVKRENSPTPSKQIELKDGDNDNESEVKDVVNLEDLDSECDLEEVVSLRRASEVSLDEEERAGENEQEEEEDADAKARKEHLEQGKVKWEIYLEYAKACGPINVVIFLGFAIGSYLINVASTFWLQHWSDINSKYGYNPNVGKYLGIYFLLGIGYSLSSLIQNVYLWIFCSIHGSKRFIKIWQIVY